MESRAKIEAANIADRQIDLAWLTEGEKIQSKLWAFKSNIGSLNGRTSNDEITEWNNLAGTYDFAIKATKNAYMPNSERQKQYLAIYDELTASNDQLLARIRFLATKTRPTSLWRPWPTSVTGHQRTQPPPTTAGATVPTREVHQDRLPNDNEI